MKTNKITLFLISLALIVGVVAGVIGVQAQGGDTFDLNPLPANASYVPSERELSTSQVYERVTQSVVNVSVATSRGGIGTGTGFVIDADGHIVTNNHVVEGANYIEVTFVDGTIRTAELIGRDPDSDLAVIQINPAQITLQPVTFVDSDQVFIGQETMAIGSPFNQAFTLTTGIVSALDRSLVNDNQFTIPEIIQTDAAINPGNSGGPLLDREGNVIGVNTAILSSTRSGSGVGFAIPSNTVRRVVPYLIANGKYAHSWLGISGTDLLPAQIEAMSLPVDLRGVVVSSVSRQGPAAQAGLLAATSAVGTPFGRLPVNGDIILSINNEPVAEMGELISYLETSTLPGDQVTLQVWRDGTVVDMPVTLGERP